MNELMAGLAETTSLSECLGTYIAAGLHNPL